MRKTFIAFLFCLFALVANGQTITGPLHGGTGISNPTIHAIALGEGSSNFTFLTVPPAGQLLTSVATADPAWSATPTLGIAGTTTGQLKLANATGSNVVTLAVPATPAAYTFTFPVNGGTNTYLLQTDGSGGTSWVVPAAGATGANPTASVGLTAVNGAASTFMRSDGAPALDVSIAPTWTGIHAWKISNATTNAIDNLYTLGHNSSGTPAAGFGTGRLIQGKTSTTVDRNMEAQNVTWTTATEGSQVSKFALQLVNGSNTLADVFTVTGAGNGNFIGTATASNLSGTNTGDQTITLTGGVTGSGTGSFTATVVTNANLTGDITSTGNATTIAMSTVLTSHYVSRETPAGTVNGTNLIFTMANTPISGTESVKVNGQEMNQGASPSDYTISGAVITFNAGMAPLTGDKVRVSSWK